MASSSSFAEPLGASSFWLWWVSVISMSKSGLSTPETAWRARTNTAIPREKLAAQSTGAAFPRVSSCLRSAGVKPVVPESRGVPVRRT